MDLLIDEWKRQAGEVMQKFRYGGFGSFQVSVQVPGTYMATLTRRLSSKRSAPV
jgi:hypothetical protein